MSADLLMIAMLWRREIIRFYRQPGRIVGALGSPLIFWLLIGSGINRSFQADMGGKAVGYLEYFFPGTLLMILLFTAIFSTFSLIEDKKEGFLQGVLVAPVSRLSIAVGKILGGATLAWLQGILFLALTPLMGLHLSFFNAVILLVLMFLSAFSLTGLGFVIAWRMSSIQAFHAIMNLVLLPLWLLSGALFPASGASGWLKVVMYANPLHYQLTLMRSTFYPGLEANLMLAWVVTALFTGAIVIFSALTAGKRSPQDLV